MRLVQVLTYRMKGQSLASKVKGLNQYLVDLQLRRGTGEAHNAIVSVEIKDGFAFITASIDTECMI